MPTNVDQVLSKTLIEKGLLTQDALDPLVMKAAESSGGLASFLVKRGMVPEEQILNIISERFNIPRVDLTKVAVDKATLNKVPLKFAEYYRFAPIRLENRKLTIAVSVPLDIRTQDEIRTHLGCEILMMLAREQDIIETTKKWYGLGADTVDKMVQTSAEKDKEKPQGQVTEEPEEKVEDIGKMAEDASVIKLVNQILLDAFKRRATDIHIEPFRGKLKVRYRIDGVLHDTNMPPEIKKFMMPILSRIKIMSNLNIIERRLPQDGRAIVKIQDEALDLRISCIPTPTGESVVIRLLPTTRLFSLEKLGLEESEMKIFNTLINKPHGIIFITGPTGSGKSTTLYACLSMINTEERKIITIEDPVEYEMDGIIQIQVTASVGLDFARGLRSILRHDPDVIMVGEVRDLETAETAARVALTGHMVFSTLHTNDAASGITRLVDIGVEPYLVASSVEAFIAQRLVRTICPDCKQEDKKQPEEIKMLIAKELNLKSNKDIKLYHGEGCDKCNGTGHFGRIAIYEILVMDEAMRELVIKRVPSGQIKKLAVMKGMRTLRQSGWKKVIAGVTTPEEILEVAQDEPSVGSDSLLPAAEPVVSASTGKSKTESSSSSQLEKRPSQFERRIYKRLDAKVNIRYRVIKAPELEKKNIHIEEFSTTKNISAGGLVFTAHELIAMGAILELKIELPSVRLPIECLARVVRVEEMDPQKDYDTAVCFLDLSGTDRTQLDKYVQEEIT